MAKQKFYVVWNGAEDGVYTTWEACKEAVEGFSGAKYQAFKTEEEAEEAFEMGYEAYKEKEKQTLPSPSLQGGSSISANEETYGETNEQGNHPLPIGRVRGGSEGSISNAIAVDAACSGNPGKMEYRGVYLRTGKEIFHYGPVWGTNNIGEFLAIVHGLALLPIYSDSVNAQLWVKRKKCKTTLERNEKSEGLYQLIERAEKWLRENTYRNPIIKWPTEEWGEIPADFGRKGGKH